MVMENPSSMADEFTKIKDFALKSGRKMILNCDITLINITKTICL